MKKEILVRERTPLSPVEIYKIHKMMWDWSVSCEEIYMKLTFKGFNRSVVNDLLKSLLKKTSAVKALEVMSDISFNFGLIDLNNFCVNKSFSQLLGVNQVANMTLSGLYFNSHIENDLSNFFGGIKIDFDRRGKLGLMLSEHDEIQQRLNVISLSEKLHFKYFVDKIMDYSISKKYPLNSMLSHGQHIKEILDLASDPIKLGFSWTGIESKVKGQDFDFYPISKNNQDGGFFQYLCIVLFSLEF